MGKVEQVEGSNVKYRVKGECEESKDHIGRAKRLNSDSGNE